ncbi:Npt1/Npt2 family nucleotide transporter [Chlamydiifrater phoenicopteri]|uniref:Npt1/Npt2 family nucleotide transporter n=1 Tax=Chlamydiifrater phoenicopteri TaxID=2681469 RepID=UPI001BCAAF50|nr:Npt1/Npt2 family nucleotide transporter [Chlamydiifrater phoenicopteri]
MQSDLKDFSRLRACFWPVYRSELHKFLPLFLLAFFVGFNYSLLKNMKDALMVAAAGAGAEVIPFIKVWGIVPGAVVVTAIYGALSARYPKDVVFYLFLSFFVVFFTVFVLLIYPSGDVLHLHGLGDKLSSIFPKGLRGFIVMVRYWSYTLFYVISELWSSIVLSVFFWGLANDVTTIREAGRFYALINAALNFSSIVAGEVSVFVGKGALIPIPFAKDEWHGVMINLVTMVCLASVAIFYLYRRVHYVGLAEAFVNASELISSKKKQEHKGKSSLKDVFSYVIRSKYLLGLAFIVLAYNLVNHLFEVVWKDQVSKIYSTAIEYNAYMGRISTLIGVLSVLVAVLLTGQTIRAWGWTFGALVTPVVAAGFGVVFFLAIFLAKKDINLIPFWHITPLALSAWLGGLHNVFTRSAKFTFFDQIKEMAFIPLGPEEKRQGKAAIDGVVSRVGKSGGSLIYQCLLVFFSSVAASLHIIASVLFVILLVWVVVTIYLGRQIEDFSDSQVESLDERLESSSQKSVANTEAILS